MGLRKLNAFFFLPSFSPRDAQLVLRLLLTYLLWKFLSQDYRNFASLKNGPELFPLPEALAGLGTLTGSIFSLLEAPGVVCLQVLVASVIVTTIVFTLRPLVFASGLLVCIFLLESYKFNASMFDLDLPVALLFLAACAPFPWLETVAKKSNKEFSSSLLVNSLTLYMGFVYFLAGLSKLIYVDGWLSNVKLVNVPVTMKVYHGLNYPAWIEGFAFWHAELLADHPSLEYVLGLSTLAIELGWPILILLPVARPIGSVLVAGFHAVIFATTSILFLSFMCIQFSLLLPFKKFERWHPLKMLSGSGRAGKTGAIFYVILVVAAAMTPAINRKYYPPFADYSTFGWVYNSVNLDREVYRLGYYDPEAQEYSEINNHQGGFMDFRWVSSSAMFVAQYVATIKSNPQAARLAEEKILQVVNARLPRNSNRFLLRPFAHPNHLVSAGTFEANSLRPDEIYVLKGKYSLIDGEFVGEFTPIGRVNENGSDIDWQSYGDAQ